VSIELGHPQVTQDHVRALRLKCSQGVAAIACRRHDVPVSPEEPGERADQAGLIIKNQYASRGVRSHTHRRVTHQPWHLSEPSTSRKRVRPPCGSEACLCLLRVLYLTPRGGGRADQKRLEGWLHLPPKDGTLLIDLHGLQGVPETDGTAAVGLLHVFGEPPAPQARHRCVRHGGPRGLLIRLPTAGPPCPYVIRIIRGGPPGTAPHQQRGNSIPPGLPRCWSRCLPLSQHAPGAQGRSSARYRRVGLTSRIDEILLSLMPWSFTFR
jgi:hypothetical protein